MNHPVVVGIGFGLCVLALALNPFFPFVLTRRQSCVRCLKCRACAGACDCTGGPQIEPECTCYELTGGHQLGCYFNRPQGSR